VSRRRATVRERERRAPGLVVLALVWRHLLRHRLRTGLTLLGVALGVAVAVAVQLANQTALASFADTARAVAGPAAWQLVAPGGELPETILPKLRPLADLATFSPVVEAPAVLDGRPEIGLRLLGTDLLAPAAFRGYADAGQPGADAGWPGGLFLTDVAARKLGVRPGDRLALVIHDRRAALPVAGILRPSRETAGLDPWVAFMDVAALQEIAGRVGSLDRLDVVPREGVPPAAVKAALAPLAGPDVVVAEPAEATRTAERMLAAFRLNMMALSFVALIVGGYLIYNAVAISVVQRRREIAIMRSLGALRRQVFGIFALEALLVGLAGGAAGLGLGALLAHGAVGAVGRTVDALYVATAVDAVAWGPGPFAAALGAGLAVTLVAALAPALEAAGTPPALAMRAGSWEAKQRGRAWPWAALGAVLLGAAAVVGRLPAVGGVPWAGYAAAALLVLGCSFWAPIAVEGVARVAGLAARAAGAPASATLAAGNFRRAVGRNAVAVAAVMVGCAMTIGVATMVGSFRTTVAAWIETTLPGSFYLHAPSAGATGGLGTVATVDPKVIDRLKPVPGVVAVEGFRERLLPYAGVTIHLGGADMDVLAAHGRLVLRDGGDARALYRALIGRDKVLVSEALTIKHGVDAGGRVVLPTPGGPRSFEVVAVYHDYASDQGYVLMDRGTYRRHWHDDLVTDIAVYTAPGADLAAVRGGLRRALGDAPLVVTGSEALRGQVMQVFDDTFAITYALHLVAIAVSLLGVAGTLAALVLERTREIAVLRQVGLLRRQIAAMIVTEAGLIGATGAALGLVAGGMLAALLIGVINRQSFGWTVHFEPPYGFAAVTVLAVVASAMAAGWLPARGAAATPIAEGLRDE
jgi:putative ABC transport system permease protein